jgi:predicted aspartyl protease
MSLRMPRAVGVLLLISVSTLHVRAQEFDRPRLETDVPFDLVSNFEVVVRGKIGKLEGLRFILDTGSSYSVIDRRVADRMRLQRRPGKVFNFDRNLAVEWADVRDVVIGPLQVPGISMMVANLADVSEFAESVDGILGLDVLTRAKKLRIDYQQRTISFELEQGRRNNPSTINALVMTVAIQGIPMRFVVDTGSRCVLLYRDRIRSALPHLRIEGEPLDAMIGRVPATRVNLPGLDVFRPETVTPVFLIEGPQTKEVEGIDGYLGPTSLHAKKLELDFSTRILYWQ